jgi:hypothetical protein
MSELISMRAVSVVASVNSNFWYFYFE